MKRTSLMTAITAATLLSGFTLFAGPEGGEKGGEHARRGPGGPEGRPSKEEILKKFDANGDGQLDETEKAAAKAARDAHMAEMKAKFLKEFDTNGDGQLDETERAAAKAARDAREGGKGEGRGEGRGKGKAEAPAAQ